MVCPSASGPSTRRQCELLGVNRSSIYYEPVGVDRDDLELMRVIDELHLKRPFYGSRRISAVLRAEGRGVNRKRVQRLMQHMGLEGLAPKPKTSTPGAEKPRFPYLLRDLNIDRVNLVWAADITYIPMARGFAYLVAIMDWASRCVLAWRLSNTMDPQFCLDALHEALSRFQAPRIFNTDQGAQFTASAWTTALLDRGVKVSMDGKGRWMDECLRRAPVAISQVRRGLSARLRRSHRRPPRHPRLVHLLQWRATARDPGLPDPEELL